MGKIDGRGSHPNSRKNLDRTGKHNPSMEKNGNWKGKKASYTAFHHWLKNNYGKASKCENTNCIYPRKLQRRGKVIFAKEPKMFQWALLKGKRHEQKIENYIQLCVSCHEKYDKNK